MHRRQQCSLCRLFVGSILALASPILLLGCGDGNGNPGPMATLTPTATATRTPTASAGFTQTNLVADVAGGAANTDAHLLNPWGIAYAPTGPFWVSDNHSGVSTLYNGSGVPFPTPTPLVVTIPPPGGSSDPAAPTGIVFNGTAEFVVTEGTESGPSLFIFSTEDGTLAGWSQAVDAANAILTVDNSATDAIYKGLALGSNAAGNFLFATDFHNGRVDVFDKNFAPATLAGSFTDPNIPAGFAPFGIQNVGGSLYVTYAKQDDDKEDDERGPGNGFVDVFDTNGIMMKRFASQGTLNSPWGIALAPASFGQFGNAVLIGNFGDGRINAFDAGTGAFLGQLGNTLGVPIAIDGLWALTFGNGATAGSTNTLFFTAGPGDEEHGLFGSLAAASG
jgi:uncharacterized protein (TIGR03118 family)